MSWSNKAGLRVRLLSPLGRYPNRSVGSGGHLLLIRDEIAVSSVQVQPNEAHGMGIKEYSELEHLSLEEIRFFAAVSLAMPPEHGMIYAYPLNTGFTIETCQGNQPDPEEIIERACTYVASIETNKWATRGAILPKVLGGPAYQCHDMPIDETRLEKIICRVNLQNRLMLRGLGALLRADMLWQHPEFLEFAFQMLCIALEVSFQVVLELLRDSGIENPTAQDAGLFISNEFNAGMEPERYFSYYYDARIRALHPLSRFGTYAVPPLSADDYYHLRIDLVTLFSYFITGSELDQETKC